MQASQCQCQCPECGKTAAPAELGWGECWGCVGREIEAAKKPAPVTGPRLSLSTSEDDDVDSAATLGVAW